MKVKLVFVLLPTVIASFLFAQTTNSTSRMDGLKRNDGFIAYYWDEKKGELLFELTPAAMGREFLYFTGLASGVGSTELFADRSSITPGQLCRFRRVGPKVLVVAENTAFRATNGSAELQRSVEASFPVSVIASLPIEAEQNGALIVNVNPLVVRDSFDLLGQLSHPLQASNGNITRGAAAASAPKWHLDADRSVVELDHTRAFPLNTEVEALLTFATESGGARLNQPEEHSLSVREHHSLVQLPEPGFEAREFDPRVGFLAGDFQDFSRPFDQPWQRALIRRWRLQKKNPGAGVSEPIKPIVFYLDRAIPEPVRSAARKGALWWNEAFEQAGFKNALVIEDLPEGADPLDIRYPTIQWTNRSGRGWSVGMVQVDPRTGEILHGVVQLDSHRMRTVHNYWSVLEPPSAKREANPGMFAELDSADPQLTEEEAMTRRLALLTCHEMGHVLGLNHNFVASTFGRGSVMDYFAPNVKIRADGSANMSDAYMQGVGSYDKFAIEWGYSTLGQEQLAAERKRLDSIIERWNKQGVIWGSFRDPRWNAYDDGPDPVTWLRTVLPVRDALMKSYTPAMMRKGEPWSDFASRYALIYLFHRYALAATANVVGSAKVPPALVGDANRAFEVWAPDQQREALRLLIAALNPKELRIPAEVWTALSAGENFEFEDKERFQSPAGYVFSPQDAARAVADVVFIPLFDPQRIERLIAIHSQQADAPGADEVITAVVRGVFTSQSGEDQLGQIIQTELAERLMVLAADDKATAETQAAALQGVIQVQSALKGSGSAHAVRLSSEIERFRRDPMNNTPKLKPSGAPEGPPI